MFQPIIITKNFAPLCWIHCLF